MIDWSKFKKLAEYKNGEWHDYTKGGFREKNVAVYAIQFSDGSLYIGSTKKLRKRVHEHYTGMINGYHSLTQLVEVFNTTKEFAIYLLAQCVNVMCLEAMFIAILQPSLNRDSALSHNMNFDKFLFDIKQQ